MDELIDSPRVAPRIRRVDTNALAGGLIIFLFVIIAVFGGFFIPDDDLYWPTEISWADDPHGYSPHPPDQTNLLGTVAVRIGHRQMDVFTTLVVGSRSALIFGLTAAVVTCFLGTLLGAFSAAIGGWVSDLMMRITDALLTLPVVVGVIVIRQLFLILQRASFQMGPMYQLPGDTTTGLFQLINPVWMALILFSWMPYARLSNTLVLRVKHETFVTAAVAMGADAWTILWKHLLPNSLTPVVILLARDIGGFVLLQSAFTFIGLGGESEWGMLLAYARDWIIGPGGSLLSRWWVYLPITLAQILFGVGWNLLGDAINTRLNPQVRNQ